MKRDAVLHVRPRWLPEATLLASLTAGLAAIIYVSVAGILGSLPSFLSALVMVAAAALVRRRLPDHPLSGWFAVAAGLSVFVSSPSSLVRPREPLRQLERAIWL
jgi:uncharacterized membrane protein YhaH (DUF805 family)